jgi:hypothetical protein
MNDRIHPTQDDPQLPAQLTEDLAALTQSRALVPSDIDQAVMAEAKSHLANVTARPSSRTWLWRVGAVVAASVLVSWAVNDLMVSGPAQREPMTNAHAQFVAADITRDGQVDIVDAMVLARRVETQQPLVEEWDFNIDGQVTRADADVIAMQSVLLQVESVSGDQF